jgi:hypothetical protein
MADPGVAAAEPMSTVGTPKLKRRRPWLAGILALLRPGLGHLYVGKPVGALSIPFLGAVAFSVCLVFSALRPRWTIPLLVVGLFAYAIIWIWQLVSAYLVARRQSSSYALRWYNRPIIYVVFIIGVPVLWSAPAAWIRQRVVEPFKIPSASWRRR